MIIDFQIINYSIKLNTLFLACHKIQHKFETHSSFTINYQKIKFYYHHKKLINIKQN